MLNGEYINRSPRWESSAGWLLPQSHLVRSVVQPVLSDVYRDDAETLGAALGRAEFRIALAQHLWNGSSYRRPPAPGEFILDGNWDFEGRLSRLDDLRVHGDTAVWGFEVTDEGFSDSSAVIPAEFGRKSREESALRLRELVPWSDY